jgi:subtilisin family serine protease
MTFTRAAVRSVLAAALVVSLQATLSPQFAVVDKIEPALRDAFARQREATYIVYMKDQATIAASASTLDRDARGWLAYRTLRGAADRAQAASLALLAAEQRAGRVRRFKSFFSVNAIGVTGSALPPAALVADPGVDRIVQAPVAMIPPIIHGTPQAQVQSVEWNIATIRAPEVWAAGFTGQGIVVANIDTGVQFDHPALVDHYRGNLGSGTFDHNYNWFDPQNSCGNPSVAPCDQHGHGSHTMGTMIGGDGGDNQIGIAPGAKWMACAACPGGVCNLFALLDCGDWIMAPTDLQGNNPDPTKRPDVVNNSWGFITGSISLYRTMVQNWRAAGIFPAFANGNNGPACGSSTSPGDYPESFSAGAIDMNDAIASFSGRGPSAFAAITKPDAAAPGVNVRSSVPTNAYDTFSGTSMASPHVAGTVALLWSRFPVLRGDITNTENQLRPSLAILNQAQGCGGNGPNDHPNNVFGGGRLDAVRATTASALHTDRGVYVSGDTVHAALSLLNPLGSTNDFDLYLAGQAPGTTPALIGSPTMLTLPAGFELFSAPLFSFTFTPAQPTGTYVFYTLVTRHGADPANQANWLSFDATGFTKQ